MSGCRWCGVVCWAVCGWRSCWCSCTSVWWTLMWFIIASCVSSVTSWLRRHDLLAHHGILTVHTTAQTHTQLVWKVLYILLYTMLRCWWEFNKAAQQKRQRNIPLSIEKRLNSLVGRRNVTDLLVWSWFDGERAKCVARVERKRWQRITNLNLIHGSVEV